MRRFGLLGAFVVSGILWYGIILLVSSVAHAGWFDKEYTCESPEVRRAYLEQVYGGLPKMYGMSLEDVRSSPKEQILEKCLNLMQTKCNSVFDCNLGKFLCEQEAEAVQVSLEVEDSSTYYSIGANPDIGQYQCIRKIHTPGNLLPKLVPRMVLLTDLAPEMAVESMAQAWQATVKNGKTQEDWDFYYPKLMWRANLISTVYSGGLNEEVPFTVQPSNTPPGFLLRINPPELKHLRRAY